MNEPRRWLESDDSEHAQHRSVLSHGTRHSHRPLDAATRRRMRQRVAALSATAVGASVFVGWLKALAAGLGLSAVVAGATVATLVARDAWRADRSAPQRAPRAAHSANRTPISTPNQAPIERSRREAPSALASPTAAPGAVLAAQSTTILPPNSRPIARSAPRSTEAPRALARAESAPARVESAASITTSAAIAPSTASSTIEPAPTAQPVAAVPDALTRERLMLEPARAALAGDPAAALAAIERYQRAFESGQLLAESEYIAIEALRRSGRRQQADARADALVQRFPQSVYATLLRRQRAHP